MYNFLINIVQYVQEHFDGYVNEYFRLLIKEIKYKNSRKKKILKTLYRWYIFRERHLDQKTKFKTDIRFIICDRFLSEFNKWISAYIVVVDKFKYLFNENLDCNEIINQIKNSQECIQMN